MKYLIAAGGKSVFAALLTVLMGVSTFGQATLHAAVDQDDDGKADYMIFRPSNNTWYIWKSSGGFTFQAFGLANDDFMAPGDFDGDGKGDISVWRDTNGVWYRLNSSNNTFFAQAWGTTGDEPVGRDYDNDGKTDLAVVRRSNGALVWYILRS